MATKFAQWREERADENATRVARVALDAVLISARDADNPCDGLPELDAAIQKFKWSKHGGVARIVDEMHRPRLELARTCCDRRLTQIRVGLTNLNRSGVPAGEIRSDMLAVLGSVIEAAEERTAVLGTCGAAGVLEQIAAVVMIERGYEQRADAAWRGYARLLEAEASNRAGIGELLVPKDRRAEFARQCIRAGMPAAEQATRQGEHEDAAKMLRDVSSCVAQTPTGVDVSVKERTRLESLTAAAERRRERASSQAYEAARRSKQAAARRCMLLCERERRDILDCAARCAAEHPDVAYEY